MLQLIPLLKSTDYYILIWYAISVSRNTVVDFFIYLFIYFLRDYLSRFYWMAASLPF